MGDVASHRLGLGSPASTKPWGKLPLLGTDKGVNYWKVKNSWGPQWGEGGYVRIERGLPGPGECGIKSMASYPVVRGSHGPSPGPSPSPPSPAPPAPQHCSDIEAFCTNPELFNPSEDCEVW